MIARIVAKRGVFAVGLGLLVGASRLSAQQHEHEAPDQVPEAGMMGQGMGMSGMMQQMMGPGMMQMMGQGMGMMATGGPSPATILRMGEALELTDEQTTRLQGIQGRYTDAARMPMQSVMETHGRAAAALEGDSPDFEAYESALRDGAARMVEAHVAMARAAAEARTVLTEEQRARLENVGHMMRGMMGGGGGMMGPGGR